MLFFWVKWLHILATSAWFGINLLQAGDIKTALALGGPHLKPLASRINKIHATSLVSGFLTILTGFAMILLLGGFAYIPGRIHAGLGLTLLLYALEYLLVIGQWKKILAILDAGEDTVRAMPYAKRYAMGVGIGHLLRTMIFATMVIQF